MNSAKKNMFIGDYQIIQKLGSGTTSKVFLAENRKTKELRAIKRIKINFIKKNRNNKTNLLNKLPIMNKVKHPNLIYCFEIYETSNHFYIIMEYCNKGSLEFIRQSKSNLSEITAICYLTQIMEEFEELQNYSSRY